MTTILIPSLSLTTAGPPAPLAARSAECGDFALPLVAAGDADGERQEPAAPGSDVPEDGEAPVDPLAWLLAPHPAIIPAMGEASKPGAAPVPMVADRRAAENRTLTLAAMRPVAPPAASVAGIEAPEPDACMVAPPAGELPGVGAESLRPADRAPAAPLPVERSDAPFPGAGAQQQAPGQAAGQAMLVPDPSVAAGGTAVVEPVASNQSSPHAPETEIAARARRGRPMAELPPRPAAELAPVSAAIVRPAAIQFAAAIRRALRDDLAPATGTAMSAAGFQGASAVTAPAAAPVPLDLAGRGWPEAAMARIEGWMEASSAEATSFRVAGDAIGAIDVALRREDDAVAVDLSADRPETRRLLAEAQPRLAELAEQRGVRLAGATAPSSPLPSGPSSSGAPPFAGGGASGTDVAGGNGSSARHAPAAPRSPANRAPAGPGLRDIINDTRVA